MRIADVQSHLMQLDGGWVDRDKTVDTLKFGDPDTQVTGIAVGWMSYQAALEEAVRLGCNLFITHEPTFYDHFDRDPASLALPAARHKREFLESSGLAVLRCHDLWDQYPGIGIPDSWAQFLGFGPPVAGTGFFRVLDVTGHTAGTVAAQIARRVLPLGQEAVQLIGNANQPVTRLAIGTGAITPFPRLVAELDADMYLCTDDGFTYWRDGALAIDSNQVVAIVHHHVAEQYGLKQLAAYLQRTCAPIPVHHIPQRCMYRLISGTV